jgi:hypothetical protein
MDTHSYFKLIVNSCKKYFVAQQHWKGYPLLHFHGNTKHSYTIDSYINTNKNKKEMYCFHDNNGYVNTPQCNNVCVLSILLLYTITETAWINCINPVLVMYAQISVLATGTSTVTMQLLQFDSNFPRL